ncbi:VOC family protein [Pseudalkalibacillus berkeleyi]|uniref:VOC family protein n=1 Tax=Pseudalkalibacillus berkeleyi TaxID=1069813 RepID=A0ABS9H468_9BACL|nr:VOC family protein [Pseudalkalibacillus berkeleyi]MCF6138678.1 VOC family protein [Pseudalkalibacillus berkeleyi]
MTYHRLSNPYVDRIHLIVSNLKHSLSFYKNILGFKELEKNGNIVVLTADGKHPLVTLEEVDTAQPKQRNRTGLFHFAILLPTRKDLGNFINHVKTVNHPIQGGSDHLFSEALYLADPDGHGIEVYRDLPSEQWTWQNGELPLASDPIDIEGVLEEADGQWDGLPSETVLGHIHLHVHDLEAAKDFYVNGLGFDITIPIRQQALFVSTGGYHHHIGLNTWNGKGIAPPDESSMRMKSYSITYATEQERDHVISQLNELGYDVVISNDRVLTKDPSGNSIQLSTHNGS